VNGSWRFYFDSRAPIAIAERVTPRGAADALAAEALQRCVNALTERSANYV
jgi:hypothetical protein